MSISRRTALAGLGILAGTSVSSIAQASVSSDLLAPFEGIEDFWLATDAYIYGYPLVTMEMTRRVMTNVAARKEPGRQWDSSSSCGNIRWRLSVT